MVRCSLLTCACLAALFASLAAGSSSDDASSVPVGQSRARAFRAPPVPAAAGRQLASLADSGAMEDEMLQAEHLAPNPASTTGEPFPEVYGAACHGKEVEWGACTGQKSCEPCTPRNCEFADWSDWFQLGGCTGLCVRERAISVANNECGRPCEGPKQATRSGDDCLPGGCKVETRDCQWAEWSTWSDCRGSRTGQSFRTRQLEQQPVGFGRPCEGNANQTRPCGTDMVVDCQLSPWEEWTKCSSACDGGYKARERSICRPAADGGAPCADTTRMTVPCNTQQCRKPEPCVLSDWGDWEGCNTQQDSQQFRERMISRAAREGGRHCDFPLRETKPCVHALPPEPMVCSLSTWGQWSECSGSCGGQRFRRRRLENETRQYCFVNTDFPLKEVTACGPQPCISKEDSCALSAWSQWSDCSAHCGVGASTRTRNVDRAGLGCTAALKEIKACMASTCEVVDCVWGDWDDWSGCSCSCGGCLHRRNRIIVKAPRYGGKLCDAKEKYEVAPCGTQPCDRCVDGQWGDWGDWSSCSGSCSPAHRVRHRSVGRPPNHCGRPVSGLEDEFEMCVGLAPCVPSADCEFSAWAAWSACSQQCFGLRERRRHITQVASGLGLNCNGDLLEMLPCNPAPSEKEPEVCGPPQERACRLSSWSAWTECSVSCGTGQKKRDRSVSVPNHDGGKPCSGALREVVQCAEQSCAKAACRDCRWSQWSDWGACSKCGGERYRHRNIEQMPDSCGVQCDAAAAKEAGPCKSDCKVQDLYCLWTPWSDMTHCTGRCGRSSRIRSRQLRMNQSEPDLAVDYMGHGFCLDSHGKTYDSYGTSTGSKDECTAVLGQYRTIPGIRGVEHNSEDQRCRVIVDAHAPRLAEFSGKDLVKGVGGIGPVRGSIGGDNWRCWSMNLPYLFKAHPDTSCSGVQTDLAECPMVRCEDRCRPVDCVFSPWGDWNADCTQLCERQRTISQMGACGGRPCEGPLVETKDCPSNCSHVQDCLLGDWSEWSPGDCKPPKQRTRSRPVMQMPQFGGMPCDSLLEETAPCGENIKTQDCEMGLWSAWTSCSRSCGAGIRVRSRGLLSLASQGGMPCSGNLQELQSCVSQLCISRQREGQWSLWSHWSQCTDGGLMFRHRNVSVEPRDGGQGIQGPVLEAKACSGVADCVVSDWTRWSTCSQTCGGGEQHRHRQVTQNPVNGGRPCPDSLQEVQGCNREPCLVDDCQVSDWSEWSNCSATCGAGQRTKARYVDRPAGAGGNGCNLNLTLVEACEGGACAAVVDCAWGSWGEWGGCSCDCDGGTRTRSREVVRMPSVGGKPCEPKTKEELASCNTQPCHKLECIDGAWDDWQAWSTCTATCNGGITQRSRMVKQAASDCGKPLVGFKVEHASCNPQTCEASVDCQFSEWAHWGPCAAMADVCVGRRERKRQFKQHGRGDGNYCVGALKEEQQCIPSGASGCEARAGVNCELAAWEPWGPCSVTCGKGQTVRQRIIATPEKNGGRVCDGPLEATMSCEANRDCQSLCEKQDCAFSQWSAWSDCTTCGGQKTRSRHIERPAKCGGAPCQAAAAEEVTDCPRQCHKPQFCVWGEWSQWNSCIKDCGNSLRSRQRLLRRVSTKPSDLQPPGLPSEALTEGQGPADLLESLQQKFASLQERRAHLEARRYRDLALCFGAGCVSLFGLLFSVRTCSRAHCMDVQEHLHGPNGAVQTLWSLVWRPNRHQYQALQPEDRSVEAMQVFGGSNQRYRAAEARGPNGL